MKKTIVIITVLTIIAEISFAQKNEINGSISGVVVDIETQQPLPFVNIWLKGKTIGTTTDDNGNYAINNVSVGRYTLVVKMLGYEQESIADITVVPRRSTIVNINLKQSYIEMEEVVVQPDYFSQRDDKSINSITSIGLEEIKRTSGVPDLFRRLQAVAGVNKTADNSPALIVRGGAPDENLTIIENVEVYSPFHFSSLSGGMVEGISIIQPKIINNVTFITGGFNSQYGDKLSSVTEIQLQQPSLDRINTDITLDVSGFGAIVSGPLTNKASWMISGRRSIYDLLMKIRGKDFSPRTTDIHTKFIFQPNKEHKFTLYGLYVVDQLERTKDDEDLGLDEQLKYKNLTKNMSALGITWTYLFSKNGYLKITPYLNTNNWKMTEGREQDNNDLGQENEENFFGINTFVSYRFNHKHRLIGGTEIKYINTTYNKWAKEDTLFTGIIQPAYNTLFGPEKALKSAAYFHYFYAPFEWLKFNAGLRSDYFDFTDEIVISPRLGLQFIINEKLQINTSYGLFAQYPPFYKIFLDTRNANLKTNKSTHYITGFKYLISEDLQLKIEGFYKDMNDLAVAQTDTSKLYTSTGTGSAKGIEFTITKKLSSNLYLLLNYTYCKSVRKDAEYKQEYTFDYDSPNMANLMATYKLGDWWDFSLSCRYSTGLPYTPYDISTRHQINGNWYCEKGEKNSQRLPDYFRVDVRVDRRFVFSNYNITAFVEIWNLTNNENVISYDHSDDFLTKEPVTLFSLMPMIGVSVEF
ncbi:MAG: TonB-dependent receptor [Bacteroidota bacterium]